MDDLISRQAAIDVLEKWLYDGEDRRTIREAIIDIPSAQPERKKGMWNQIISMPKDEYGRYYCSECGKEGNQVWYFCPNFCPNCGADMREGGEG